MKKPFLMTLLLGLALTGLVAGLPALANTHSAGANATNGYTTSLAESNINVLYQYDGELVGETFGWVGANLGDINNDGANEFAITAPFYPASTPFQGRVFIYNGSDGSVVNTKIQLVCVQFAFEVYVVGFQFMQVK